jgi:hypothetical protein
MKSEEEIIKRCRCCIFLIEIRPALAYLLTEREKGKITKVMDCKIHGMGGFYYHSEIIQNCDEYKPNFEGIMRKIIKDHEESK